MIIKVIIIVSCVVALFILLLLAVFIHYIRMKRSQPEYDMAKEICGRPQPIISGPVLAADMGGGAMVVSAEDLVTAVKGSPSDAISPDEKMAAVTGFSPSKNSHFSWSPESGDSFTAENLARLDTRSPDRLIGELHFLDETIKLTPEELSRAPAEVLGRSSHGTSYKATLESGLLLRVKWLREGVAKQRKRETKKFANIRHPNVVGLRGYYCMRSLFFRITSHREVLLVFFTVIC